jgi:hypothetical protein
MKKVAFSIADDTILTTVRNDYFQHCMILYKISTIIADCEVVYAEAEKKCKITYNSAATINSRFIVAECSQWINKASFSFKNPEKFTSIHKNQNIQQLMNLYKQEVGTKANIQKLVEHLKSHIQADDDDDRIMHIIDEIEKYNLATCEILILNSNINSIIARPKSTQASSSD